MPLPGFQNQTPYLGGGRAVVHLAVKVLGAGQVLVAFNLGLDQVVTVDGGGHSHLEKHVSN